MSDYLGDFTKQPFDFMKHYKKLMKLLFSNNSNRKVKV